MQTHDVVVESVPSNSIRARQVSAMFDAPPTEKSRQEWRVQLPTDETDWSIGLIVGPSGSGKSTVMKQAFGESSELAWKSASVIDDFAPALGVQSVADALGSVGFNTIPAWLRPFGVLSNGEKFRCEMARRMLEGGALVVVDEFTSVVDRQVAKIASHAVQKFIRKSGKRFVAVTCHYDVTDWLQPDWVLDMATGQLTRRALQRRPALGLEVGRAPYSVWKLFAPFHYLTAELNHSARCFALSVEGHVAAFAGCLYRPHPIARDIYGLSRLVTLPDYQGLGLAMILAEKVGAAFKAKGFRFHTYPAHPKLTRAFDRSPTWSLVGKPGQYKSLTKGKGKSIGANAFGGRPNATFAYCGPAMGAEDAQRLIDWK